MREAAEARGPVATRERRAGGADNCEYERAVRLIMVSVVRRSAGDVGLTLAGVSRRLPRRAATRRLVSVIFVYLRG